MYEIVDRRDPQGVSYIFERKTKWRTQKLARRIIGIIAELKRRKPETFAIRNVKTGEIVA
jgi:hypothetical protein